VKKAQKSGSWTKLEKAVLAHAKAKRVKQAKCLVQVAPPVSTASGDPGDERPVGWVRPADGSGEPGSNAVDLTYPAGCPITIAEVRKWSVVLESGTPVWVLGVSPVNYSSSRVKFHVQVDATTEGGRYLNGVPEIPGTGELLTIDTDLVMSKFSDFGGASYTIFGVDGLDGTPATMQILRLEITECVVLPD
jgi:hypothetical protein